MDKPLNILLVEDNPDDAELICIQLRKANFKINPLRVDTERDYLAALKTKSWDLIISDYRMPEYNGLRAFNFLKDSTLDIPFIFVSGTLGEQQAVEAMRSGARDYLLKGDMARLPEVVRREIKEAENHRAQRAAEVKAKADQRRIAMAVEASGLGFFELSVHNKAPVTANERFAEIIGYSLDEIQSQGNFLSWLQSLTHPDEMETVQSKYQQFLNGEKMKLVLDHSLFRKDKQRIHVTVLANAIQRDKDNKATEVLGCIIDISGRKKLEDQFRQAQKMEAVGRLAGGVAHDFNNLLTIILSYSDLALNDLQGDEKVKSEVEQIVKAAQKAAKLTEQLLAFTRHKPVSPRVVNLNDAISDLGKMIQRLLVEDITFSFKAAKELGNIQIDPVAFEQVLINLVVNARDAMPDGGRLLVETSNVTLSSETMSPDSRILKPGDYVMVTVTDTGVGMPPNMKDKIFEPFFTTKEIGKGTGLGLSTCLGIINQAKGHISVYSELNEGTTFKIMLPRVHLKTDKIRPVSAPVSYVGKETIMIAEDDPELRELIVHVLGKWGYVVHQASNGVEALELIKGLDEPIDLLLTDMIMPMMSGKELVDNLKVIHPDLKVLFLSGYPSNVMVEKGVELTDVNLLQKPFTPGDLAKRIRQTLDLKK
ncbi:MAG: response regulator [bacterium]